jgi:PilZ domain
MTLSSQQFQDIISHLVSDQSEKFGEKRREPRVGVRFDGLITPMGPDDTTVEKMAVTVRDISPSGINVLVRKNIAKGTEFVLDLPTSDDSSMLLARYTVRHSKSLGGTLYSVGAKLVGVTNAPTPSLDAAAESRVPKTSGKQKRK